MIPLRESSCENKCRRAVPQSLAHIALIVRDYDEAIAWFAGVLGFTLFEDTYQPEQDKRWVLVAPPGSPRGVATLLLARASMEELGWAIPLKTVSLAEVVARH